MHSQHFLLEAQARKISLPEVAEWDAETVRAKFQELRWPETGGDPVCPKCGCVDSHYYLRTREQWRCKGCGHTFSLTSGTWLASTKLPLKKILIGIVALANAVKGMSALQLMRHMNVQYKTAYVFYHRLREALYAARPDIEAWSGQVEIDGAYLNPSTRLANKKEDRPEKSKRSKKPSRCILVLRQRGKIREGALRTLTFVIDTENAADIMDIVEQQLVRGTEVITDQHSAYSDLMAYFTHTQVNHDIHFVGPSGENTNQAESYFSRLRRFVRGQVHHLSVEYLDLYANEIAYREDMRRLDNRETSFDMITKLLSLERGKPRFRGYWDRTSRNDGLGSTLALAA
ncbi:IS1595 family transposase [Pseudodesulfovibrio karagichevae]|uniref:IS1595 family transposase n=1 Tax=Pseudodesulfovibrio karagichevae TaxID=3239305 RepID=A0ABV4K1R9_9BACT